MADAVDLSQFETEPEKVQAGEEMSEEQARMATAGVQWNPIHPPVTLTLGNGSVFHTEEVESVHYTNIGLYATGWWGVKQDITKSEVYTDGEDTRRSVLFLWKHIENIEFKFDKQREALEAAGEEIIPDGDGEVTIA